MYTGDYQIAYKNMKIDRYSTSLGLEFYKGSRREELWSAIRGFLSVACTVAVLWVLVVLYLLVF